MNFDSSSTANSQSLDKDLQRLTQLPLICVNCYSIVNSPRIFCSDLCRDEAKYVRYYRSCIEKGQDERPDVKEALEIRLAFILGGGYPELVRRISPALRQQVLVRDKYRCVACGSPANQIDHKNGNSNALENLQLLCVPCHNVKTRSNFTEISLDRDAESYFAALDKTITLDKRVFSTEPLQICDSKEWESLWKKIQSTRKAVTKAHHNAIDREMPSKSVHGLTCGHCGSSSVRREGFSHNKKQIRRCLICGKKSRSNWMNECNPKYQN